MRSEREVLVEQLEEMLDEGVFDGSDALEVATLAGLAHRLGADDGVLVEVKTWRAGPGQPLLDEVWEEVDPDEHLDALEAAVHGSEPAEVIEEALYDVDDLIAAAVWSGTTSKVRSLARGTAGLVRDIPEAFVSVVGEGRDMARLRAIAENHDLYDYWLAIADCG